MSLFTAVATVNLWQSVVGLNNRQRIKDDVNHINHRIKADPQLKKLFKNHRRRAIFTGVCLKVLTAGLATGLDDLGSIANAFVELDGTVPPDDLPSKVIEHFKAECPNIAAVDDGFHTIDSGITDSMQDELGGDLLTGHDNIINTETTVQELSNMHQGNATGDMVAAAAVPGAVGEVAQQVTLLVEHGADAYQNDRFNQKQQNSKNNVQDHKLQEHKLS